MNADPKPLPGLLLSLLATYGVEQVNMAWVGLLTSLESQLKTVLKKEQPAPTPPPTPVAVAVASPPVLQITEVPQDKKTIHRDAILKKRAELDKEGIKGQTLLSETNMKKWIADGLSYWKIAEQTGVWDAEVSVAAKSFGLQSAVSNKYIFKKH
tara:strand:+ start:1017 stop:1478 length:462 start_codon:yes stop_codon:yes gene_type:complete